MTLLSRRFLLVAALAGLLLAGLCLFLLTRGDDLRTRLALISVGMPRAQVVAILGRPALALRRAKPGTGELLVWVDQFWQVEVSVDGDGRVTSTKWTRSDSLYWRTVGRLTDLPK
jgi:hypothetical protein